MIVEDFRLAFDVGDSDKLDDLEHHLEDPRAARYWLRLVSWPCVGGPTSEDYDGTLRCSPKKLARRARYKGEPAKLVEALVASDLLDEIQDPEAPGTVWWKLHNFEKRNPHVAGAPERCEAAHERAVARGKASAEARRRKYGSPLAPNAPNRPRKRRKAAESAAPQTRINSGSAETAPKGRRDSAETVSKGAETAPKPAEPPSPSPSPSPSVSTKQIPPLDPPRGDAPPTVRDPARSLDHQATQLIGRLQALADQHPTKIAKPRGSVTEVEQVAHEIRDPDRREELLAALDALERDGPPGWWNGRLGLRSVLKRAPEFASGEFTEAPPPELPTKAHEEAAALRERTRAAMERRRAERGAQPPERPRRRRSGSVTRLGTGLLDHLLPNGIDDG